jgi:Gas vesicle synthesis protein GvpL/GvpF
VIHVYGVVEGLEELPPLAGLDDAPLERQRIGELEVVLSRAATPTSAEVTREAVLLHAQVVEELLARSVSLLPAQLGRGFRDDEELSDALRAQAQELGERLQQVRGCVEFGLRALAKDASEGETATGSGYMRARLDDLRRQDRLVAELHEPLASLARESTLHRGPAGEIRAAYLVEGESADAFRKAAERAEGLPAVMVVCTGPWAPYSFAGTEARR